MTTGARQLPALLVLALALFQACRRDHPHASIVPAPSSVRAADSVTPAPVVRYVSQRRRFALAEVELSISDLHMSRALDAVLTREHAELVVNGGFFDERGRPVGLVVSAGHALSALKPDLSGGVLTVDRGRARLFASEDYVADAPAFAIQCRPRLVVKSKINIRSDAGPRAARTAICVRDGGQTLEFVMAPESLEHLGPTLFELASELASDGCEEALNLDGGPSTGWAEAGPEGVVFSAPRAPVRHALVVKARH